MLAGLGGPHPPGKHEVRVKDAQQVRASAATERTASERGREGGSGWGIPAQQAAGVNDADPQPVVLGPRLSAGMDDGPVRHQASGSVRPAR